MGEMRGKKVLAGDAGELVIDGRSGGFGMRDTGADESETAAARTSVVASTRTPLPRLLPLRVRPSQSSGQLVGRAAQ